MSYGIAFRSPMSFTGAYADDLPVVRPALYTLPVSGFDTRLHASRGLTTEGGAVTAWASSEGVSSLSLSVPSGSTAPTSGDVDGRGAVSFDGVGNMLSDAKPREQPHTIATVLKLHGWTAGMSGTEVIVGGTLPGTSRVNYGGELSLNSLGYIAYAGTLQAIGGPNLGSIDPNGWHTIVISFNGSSSTARVDGYPIDRSVGGLARNALTLGGASSGFYAQVDIAEVVTWPRSMTADQVASVADSMREAHGLT